jgi:hypothetical protein
MAVYSQRILADAPGKGAPQGQIQFLRWGGLLPHAIIRAGHAILGASAMAVGPQLPAE